MEEEPKKQRDVFLDDTVDVSEDEYYDEESQYLADEKMYKNDDVLEYIRSRMIKYCDDNCLPLCDYLTSDILHEFMDFVVDEC